MSRSAARRANLNGRIILPSGARQPDALKHQPPALNAAGRRQSHSGQHKGARSFAGNASKAARRLELPQANDLRFARLKTPGIRAYRHDASGFANADLTDTLDQKMELNEPSIERLRLKLRYKVLYHVGHNCADVDDLVQESLVRFFRAEQRHAIRNTDELGAFLNGVCRNVILEYRRRIRREPPMDPDTPIPDRGIRPEADVLEMRDSIDNGLKELAERDRAILRCLYLEGKEKDAICREWGMTDAQFRVVLFRAKERFRRAYSTEVKRNNEDEH
jgi:RNA polymerase sigma factor (sigma-70 family)